MAQFTIIEKKRLPRWAKILLFFAFIIICGGAGLAVVVFTGGQQVIWTTADGQKRELRLPNVPGTRLVSEQRGDCFYQARYDYKFLGSPQWGRRAATPLKAIFKIKGWRLRDDRLEENERQLEFSNGKVGVPEAILAAIEFESGKGTTMSLDYRWLLCALPSGAEALADKLRTRQDIVVLNTPSYHFIEVPASRDEKSSYAGSITMLLRYNGLSEDRIDHFRDTIEREIGVPVTMRGFRESGLEGQLRVGYSRNYNTRFAEAFGKIVKNQNKQIALFDNQNEAFIKLKKLIADDIPVVALAGGGERFVVVTGYDEYVVQVNDPLRDPVRRRMSINTFLNEWSKYSLDEGERWGFPGEYGMIWLEE